ncbi:MAG TPA: hypothetical protein VGB55_04820 [Tepidisphaeraceae bacterium]|jgi:hypothetical protein
MTNLKRGNFVCPQCLKQHPWKSEWAGKQAKCPCGQMITVPPEPDEPDLMYDLAIPAGPPQPVKSLTVRTPTADDAPFDAQGRPRLGYHSGTNEVKARQKALEVISSPGRDLYAPIALLAAGLLMYAIWVIGAAGGDMVDVAITSLFLAGLTIVKTVVLIGVAFLAANLFGAFFGTFWTAVLKLAAIIVFADFAILWMDHFISSLSLGTVGGRRMGFRIFGLMFLLQTLLICAVSYFLFDIEYDDIFKVGVALAMASRLVDLIVGLVLM